jgi:hypothetical protein
MAGPLIASREALPMDLLEQSAIGDGWGGMDVIERRLGIKPADMLPEDELAVFMWGLSRTTQGRAMIEYLLDVSIRQPYRPVGTSIEETALAAAVRQGVNAIPELILKAIAKGGDIVLQRNQNGAGS